MQAKGSDSIGVLKSSQALFNQGPPAYNVSGMQTPGFNPTQRNAWDIQMAGGQAGVEGAINNAQYAQGAADLYQNQMLTGGNQLENDWSQWDNPNFQGAVRGYQDSMGEAFNRYTMPQGENAAIGQGSFGSTRHGIAQGLATSDFMNQMGRGTQKMYSDQYNLGQDRYLQADLANQGSRQNAWQGATPWFDRRQSANLGVPDALNNMGNVYSNVGNQQYQREAGMAGQKYNEGLNKWNYESQAPLNYMNAYAGQVYGSPQGGGYAPGGGGSNWSADALGAAGMGAGIYNAWNQSAPQVPSYSFNQNASPQFGGANAQTPVTWD